uniref:DevC protein n=1 Tax=Cyanothece sp. (strain PCC 7425 / ATCC 29141) TaxID=395961 RepID=B8HSS7_CYAP4
MVILAIPLAWLQLKREKIRLLVAIAGISFAVLLMMIQMGFRDALFKSSVTFHEVLNTDIVLISPQSDALIAMKSFSRRRLYQALGFEGVESVSPLYVNFAFWRNPETRKTRQLMVVGFDPSTQPINLPGVLQKQDRLKLEDVVLFDGASRAEFGPIAEMYNRGETVTSEVGGRKVTVNGLFNLGASFAADGNLITSDLNFLRLFSDRPAGLIDIGLIKVKPGTNIPRLMDQMRSAFPGDVRILTKEGFARSEKKYWENGTAIGFIFGLGTLMGFIVGTVIVYQILYTDVSDHLPEYATLKAMGYKNSYFYGVVLQESLILCLLGYLPGFVIVTFLYMLIQSGTALPIGMTSERAITVFLLTLVMCVSSGAIAMRRVQAADPADIF